VDSVGGLVCGELRAGEGLHFGENFLMLGSSVQVRVKSWGGRSAASETATSWCRSASPGRPESLGRSASVSAPSGLAAVEQRAVGVVVEGADAGDAAWSLLDCFASAGERRRRVGRSGSSAGGVPESVDVVWGGGRAFHGGAVGIVGGIGGGGGGAGGGRCRAAGAGRGGAGGEVGLVVVAVVDAVDDWRGSWRLQAWTASWRLRRDELAVAEPAIVVGGGAVSEGTRCLEKSRSRVPRGTPDLSSS
jgi:hypothetical protein